MSCGFGAVVLIFLILDHQISEQQQTVTTDPNLVAEVRLLEEEILEGQQNLVRARKVLKLSPHLMDVR